MIDIKLLRDHFEDVEKALSTRNEDFDLSKFKTLDTKRRQLLVEVEQLKSRQNAESKKIPQMKKAGEDTAPVLAEMKELSEKIKGLNSQVSEVEAELNAYYRHLDNVVVLRDNIVTARGEGRMEGRMEEKLEVAKNLKQLGISMDAIAQATGLSLEEIEHL